MLVADVVMTGKWENALNKIEAGQLDVASFNAHIREYTVKCTGELLDAHIQKTRAQLGSKLGGLVCPRWVRSSWFLTRSAAARTEKDADSSSGARSAGAS